ncbi:ABC-2 family transporter protein [Paenibacillus aurantius]|uniref:ABC-2 family transporter protein n=1 Tax=Paenibacillus aurantius TaxID=2918900 RepID=A0AA96LI35_9BACL|nr:ABC-2 family transporter protein [Paenibacillus aurantius]WNQ11912.1 ABC-2 family transporter protein [Paenibacillus aurantius]
MSVLRMYALLVRASVKSRMQYRFNFFFTSLMAAVINAVEFLMVAVVLVKFGDIQGWSVYEVGYLYAVLTLSKTVYRTLASDVHHLEKYLVTGDLDRLLIRPVPILLALMSQNFRIMLGELLQGGFILAVCLRHLMLEGQLGWASLPLTLLIIVMGSVILFSIGLATASVGFWITRISELQTFTEDASRNACQYPLTLYPGWLKFMLLSVVPVGFANYIPALYVLRGELGPWILAATAGAAGLCYFLSRRLWSLGLSRYQSTGS